MTPDEIIAVVQAFKEGKKIECKGKGDTTWERIHTPSWDFSHFDYRAKPNPKIIYVNEFDDGSGHAFPNEIYANGAIHPAGKYARRAVKYIEVLDD